MCQNAYNLLFVQIRLEYSTSWVSKLKVKNAKHTAESFLSDY